MNEAAERARFARARTGTFLALVLGYVGYYLCRQNLAAAFAPLHDAQGIDHLTFGAIASVGTLAYAIGKLVTGPLADRFGGRGVFLVGLFGSALATLVLGATGGVLTMLYVGWAANRVFQSMGWAGVVNVLPRWFPSTAYGAAIGGASISYQLGGVVATLFAGALLEAGLGWRGLFFVPAGALVVIGLVARPFLIGSPADVDLPLPPAAHDDISAHANSSTPLSERLRRLIARPSFLLLCALSFVLTVVRECLNVWTPAYFGSLGASAAGAAFKSAVFPLLGCAGTILAGWISDRLGGRRGLVVSVMLGGLTLCLLALGRLDALASGSTREWLAVVLIGLSGFLALGPYSMVGGGVCAVDAGGRELAATAAGLLDAVGYLGASAAGIGIAGIVARWGWATAFLALGGLSTGGVALAVLIWRPRVPAR